MASENDTGSVLVVDDETAVRTLLRRLLTMQDYRVIEAEDGATALKLVQTERPDIVLLDVSLPTQDGLEVLAEIRKASDVPVILVTARGAESDRVVGLRMGADDYVVKPFSAAELSARIESVLRRARATSTASAGVRLTFNCFATCTSESRLPGASTPSTIASRNAGTTTPSLRESLDVSIVRIFE